VSDNWLLYLPDPVMDQRLALANAKLGQLMAVHKEHHETRNYYFTDRYNILQRNQSEAKTAEVLEGVHDRRGGEITKKTHPAAFVIVCMTKPRLIWTSLLLNLLLM
jgi:hypothetical protein